MSKKIEKIFTVEGKQLCLYCHKTLLKWKGKVRTNKTFCNRLCKSRHWNKYHPKDTSLKATLKLVDETLSSIKNNEAQWDKKFTEK